MSSIKMTPPIKSILSCLVMLATASSIPDKQIGELGPPKLLASKPNTNFVFGESMEPSQLPIIAYLLKGGVLDIFIFTQANDLCNYRHENAIGTSVDFKYIKQLISNRIIVLFSIADNVTVVTTSLLIDLESCKRKAVLGFNWPLLSPKAIAIVSYDSGYDIISSQNDRVRFDANGDQLGNPEFFPTNSTAFSISTVSTTTRDKGYFIIDYTHQVVKFTKPDESKKGVWKNGEWIYTKDAQILTNSEHSLYSVCAYNPQFRFTVSCYQFDQLGKEKWMHSAQIEFDTVLDVKSLAGGGLVFAACKSEGNKLFFVKIGNKLEDVNIWSYSGQQTFEGARLKEYSEKDNTFTLAYMAGRYSVESQKFSLQN